MGAKLSGETAIVSGGAGGIGLSVTRALLDMGARVVAIDRSEVHCEALLRERDGQPLLTICADLGNERGFELIAATLAVEAVCASILVNVAGTVQVKPFLACTREDWLRTMEINLVSMALMCKTVLPGMADKKRGVIVNMASLSGHLATPLESMYCVSKSAVLQLTRAIAVEFRSFGIRCNSISPAMVDTAHGRAEIAALQREGIPLTMADVVAGQVRLATPDEIAKAIVFLATSESSFVSGADLVIDNAWSAGAGA
jgi:NAD(P)-dependent dehydrogenase (short-subunit alcohol dehydrogenase family)